MPERKCRGDKLNVAAMVTALCSDSTRNARIAQLVRCAREEGHCVLVLSDRIAQLKALAADLVDQAPAWYIGSTPSAERRRAEAESGLLLSTYSMAKEGLDIPRLSCLVLASPKAGGSCVEQAVGRVQRPSADKRSPVVLDVVDPYSIFNALRFTRLRFYKSQDYECVTEPLS